MTPRSRIGADSKEKTSTSLQRRVSGPGTVEKAFVSHLLLTDQFLRRHAECQRTKEIFLACNGVQEEATHNKCQRLGIRNHQPPLGGDEAVDESNSFPRTFLTLSRKWPTCSVHYSWNLVLIFSILLFHSQSCPLALWIPLSTLLSFRVILGPNSCRPARIPSTPFISFPSALTTDFSVSRF